MSWFSKTKTYHGGVLSCFYDNQWAPGPTNDHVFMVWVISIRHRVVYLVYIAYSIVHVQPHQRIFCFQLATCIFLFMHVHWIFAHGALSVDGNAPESAAAHQLPCQAQSERPPPSIRQAIALRLHHLLQLTGEPHTEGVNLIRAIEVPHAVAHQGLHALNVAPQAVRSPERVPLKERTDPSDGRLVQEHVGAVCWLVRRVLTRERPEAGCAQRFHVRWHSPARRPDK